MVNDKSELGIIDSYIKFQFSEGYVDNEEQDKEVGNNLIQYLGKTRTLMDTHLDEHYFSDMTKSQEVFIYYDTILSCMYLDGDNNLIVYEYLDEIVNIEGEDVNPYTVGLAYNLGKYNTDLWYKVLFISSKVYDEGHQYFTKELNKLGIQESVLTVKSLDKTYTRKIVLGDYLKYFKEF